MSKATKKREGLIEYHGKISESDPVEDMLYWQACSTEERMVAALEISEDFLKSRGVKYAARLDRSVVSVGKMEGPIRCNRGVRSNGVYRASSNKRS